MFSLNSIRVKKIKTKNRIIKSKIPALGTKKILKSLYVNEVRSMHGQLPIVWKKAEGFNVYDIEDNCWIAANVTILGGVKISSGSVVGAGAVVTKDIPANSVAIGVPAKVVKNTF